jgi:hypothetical protein
VLGSCRHVAARLAVRTWGQEFDTDEMIARPLLEVTPRGFTLGGAVLVVLPRAPLVHGRDYLCGLVGSCRTCYALPARAAALEVLP